MDIIDVCARSPVCKTFVKGSPLPKTAENLRFTRLPRGKPRGNALVDSYGCAHE
jgi:hypothetical protein